MPRKSAAHLVSINTAHRPPTTPQGLSPKVKVIFHDLVGSVGASHFREVDWPLLELYANAIFNTRVLQHQLEKRGYDKDVLTALKDERKMIATLAIRLRLCPSARHDRKAKALSNAPIHSEPWPDEDEDDTATSAS